MNTIKRVEQTGRLTERYDDRAFEQLFKAHYRALHAYAAVMLQDDAAAEEIVQQLFLRLWEKRGQLDVQTSVKAYLYKCVHNDSLNYIKHLKIRARYQEHAVYTAQPAAKASDKAELGELEKRLGQALNELPQQCRTIFQLSRFEELKYREIADRLDLSVKTVENQMGKALKLLRVKLADFLPLIVWLLYNRNF